MQDKVRKTHAVHAKSALLVTGLALLFACYTLPIVSFNTHINCCISIAVNFFLCISYIFIW